MSTLQLHLPTEEQAFIDKLVAESTGRPGALLGILEAVQERNPHKYLPAETLRYIAVKTGTPFSRIYSVATFYALFNLQPQGKTPSASAVGQRATRAARAICCRARGWIWAWGSKTARVTATRRTNWC